ncbi:PPC domain-containing protein (plasmid) [Haloferax larsenii]|uniref:PPC domain-containing protein n=1 Tax=Haloferax larsenii TaxID=302484 RepID=A0ABY5RJ99_HALLR|nr:PPC domain-containing protein [Haloferax larsenii]ELZ80493.1 carbohydrate binding module (family 6) protein [Haloferax larsenii JCM 13917]UVE52441.1 PPC domain-containing protein [Haloferax larsenii]
MASERQPQTDSDDGDGDRLSFSRRSYLLMAGSAVASAAAAGCLGSDDSASLPQEMRPVQAVFGYGGETMTMTESSSLSGTQPNSLSVASESESNDTRATADPVSVGTAVTGTLDSAEVDWFAFDVTAGQTVTVTLDRVPTSGITSLILYGPGGEYVDLVYVGTDTPATVDIDDAAVSGTYYAQVVDVQQGSGDYELTIADGASSGDTTTTDTTTTSTDTTTTSTDTTTTTTSTTTTTTATPTTTTTTTSSESEYGSQAYGEYGYGGITQ